MGVGRRGADLRHGAGRRSDAAHQIRPFDHRMEADFGRLAAAFRRRLGGRVRRIQKDSAIRGDERRHDARRLQTHFLVGMGPSAARAAYRRRLHRPRALFLGARFFERRARPARRARDRAARAGADRRLVDGVVRTCRTRRGRAGPAGAAPPDRRSDLRSPSPRRRRNGTRLGERFSQNFVAAAWGLAALFFVQLGLGALVAGLRAGKLYNTWPLMGGQWVPGDVFGLSPWWKSALDDGATAQFDHRLVAYVELAAALGLAFAAARWAPGTRMALRTKIVAAAALIQVALGVAALLLVVPLPLALAHQAVALLLFGLAVAHASATARDWARELSSGFDFERLKAETVR